MSLPARTARSERLEHVPLERSQAFIGHLKDNAAAFFQEIGEIVAISDIDGLRYAFRSGDVIHYRPSGNAPELRCYTEASTPQAADELLSWGLAAAGAFVRS